MKLVLAIFFFFLLEINERETTSKLCLCICAINKLTKSFAFLQTNENVDGS